MGFLNAWNRIQASSNSHRSNEQLQTLEWFCKVVRTPKGMNYCDMNQRYGGYKTKNHKNPQSMSFGKWFSTRSLESTWSCLIQSLKWGACLKIGSKVMHVIKSGVICLQLRLRWRGRMHQTVQSSASHLLFRNTIFMTTWIAGYQISLE